MQQRTARSCDACDSQAVHPWRAARASDPGLAAQTWYALVRCETCGTARIADEGRLGEASAHYTSGVYDPAPPRADRAVEWLRRLADRDRLRFVRQIPRGSRVFEVGAGDGRLLGALEREGYRVAGNEPAIPFAEMLRLRGFDVIIAPVEELELEPARHEAFVLWHVLEHLDDPARTLRLIRGWLTPKGSLVLAVPNLGSFQAAIGRDRWFHQDVPRHRTLFTRLGLARLLERCGFDVVETTTLTLDQSLLGMWQTLLNLITLEPNVLFRALKRQRTERRDLALTLLAAPLLAPLAAVAELGAGLAGRGGTIVVRAVAR